MTKQLGMTLRETILKSDLPSVIQNSGEIAIDSFLNSGALKDIPILSTILAIGNTYGSIKDFLFAKKMTLFLSCISSLTEEERINLVSKLDSDQSFGNYAGEQIIELLSRIDGEQKALFVAKALKLYARGELSPHQLQRIYNAIDRFILCDLPELKSFCTSPAGGRSTDENPITANFINSGLAYVQSGFGGGGVHPTETAQLLVQVIDEE